MSTRKERKWQSKENLLAFERNKELAAIQNQYNVEQWQREVQYNEQYNSPAAQMKRYKEAGLNPNLIYGQQNTSSAPQLSGSLSAGSPYEPVNGMSGTDMFEKILRGTQGLYEQASKIGKVRELSDPLYKAQVQNQENANILQQSEIALRKYEDGIRNFMESLNVSPSAIEEYLNNPEFKNTMSPLNSYDVQLKLYQLYDMNLNSREKRVNVAVDEALKDDKLKAIQSQYKLSDKEASLMLTVIYDIVMSRGAQANKLTRQSEIQTLQEILNKSDAQPMEILSSIMTYVFDNLPAALSAIKSLK